MKIWVRGKIVNWGSVIIFSWKTRFPSDVAFGTVSGESETTTQTGWPHPLHMTTYGSISFSIRPKCPRLIPPLINELLINKTKTWKDFPKFLLIFLMDYFRFFISFDVYSSYLGSSLCTSPCGPLFLLDHHILKIKIDIVLIKCW